jgi:quercetin dioxygenase-like cupin family protein
MRKDKAKTLVSEDLGLTTRSLLPFEENRRVEFYELRLAPHHRENADAHASGTVEHLFVARGALEVTIGRGPAHVVNEGDTICFPADLPHSYQNITAEPATLYLVMTYRDAARP